MKELTELTVNELKALIETNDLAVPANANKAELLAFAQTNNLEYQIPTPAFQAHVFTQAELVAMPQTIIIEGIDIFSLEFKKELPYKEDTDTYKRLKAKYESKGNVDRIPMFKTYVVKDAIVFNSFNNRKFDKLFKGDELGQFTLTLNIEQSMLGNGTILRYDMSNPVSYAQLDRHQKTTFTKAMMNVDTLTKHPALLNNSSLIDTLINA